MKKGCDPKSYNCSMADTTQAAIARAIYKLQTLVSADYQKRTTILESQIYRLLENATQPAWVLFLAQLSLLVPLLAPNFL